MTTKALHEIFTAKGAGISTMDRHSIVIWLPHFDAIKTEYGHDCSNT